VQRVLVLNSYHPGYVWGESIMAGIRQVFDGSDRRVAIRYEYMDSKHYQPREIFAALRELYRIKYSRLSFDVIIASDNNAFDFLRLYRDELFPGVPVVFCGVNGFDPAMLAGRVGFTGIAEDYDLKGTLDLALKMFPKTRHLAAVSGMSTSSTINRKRLQELMPQYRDRVSFIDLSGLNPPELRARLQSLPEDTVIIYISYYLAPDGTTFTVRESTSFVFQNSDLPMFSPWEYTMGHGVLGGMMLSGRNQARRAAEIAARILRGEPVSSIAVKRKSMIRPVFDYRRLRQFDISLASLPEGAVLRYEPRTFYYRYRNLVWGVTAFICYQFIIILVLMHIIARRKRAEASLRLEEARLEALLELSQMPETSMENLMRSAVRKGVELTRSRAGYIALMNEGEELDCLYPWNVMDEDQCVIGAHPAESEQWKRAVRTRLPVIENEYDDRRDDYNWSWGGVGINGSLTLPVFEEDRLVAVAGVSDKEGGFDSSDVRQLTLLVQGILQPIQKRRSREKRELLESRLRQAQKMEAIGTFAGGIAHDFNNILGTITTCGELALEDTEREDPVHEDLRHILKAAGRGKNLVGKIMTFSRRRDPELQPLQVRGIVRECMHMLQTMEPDMDIRLRTLTPSSLVLADPTQLHQVVMNICTNALQAMEDGGGALEIELEAVDLTSGGDPHPDLGPGRYVRLAIRDTGPGIDPAVQDRIFEPFFTTRKKSGGTGLGLATAHGIVKRHKGALTVSSVPGRGTTFTVLLPCAHAVRDLDLEKKPVTGPGGTEHILLVDDDTSLLYAGRKLLTRLGYSVRVCESGPEALADLGKTDDVDLMITDQVMPGMTGLDLAARVEKIRPDLPVMLYSGLTDRDNPAVVAALNQGRIRAFLAKPFNGDDLAATVRAVLDGNDS
jgi:signal transduction histidine kinase/ActR/RegA family two-component response regulator